ncbi:hypothetical protein EDD15DRAFT_2199659 [Pisolithus albus]|nr:hypothetical protein EDD15DRAFT_2199659 [Pisolithus albus]
MVTAPVKSGFDRWHAGGKQQFRGSVHVHSYFRQEQPHGFCEASSATNPVLESSLCDLHGFTGCQRCGTRIGHWCVVASLTWYPELTAITVSQSLGELDSKSSLGHKMEDLNSPRNGYHNHESMPPDLFELEAAHVIQRNPGAIRMYCQVNKRVARLPRSCLGMEPMQKDTSNVPSQSHACYTYSQDDFSHFSLPARPNVPPVPRFHGPSDSFPPGLATASATPLQLAGVNQFSPPAHGLETLTFDFSSFSNNALDTTHLLPLPEGSITPLAVSQSTPLSLQHKNSPPPIPSLLDVESGAGAPLAPMAETNSSTWQARNPNRPVIPPRISKKNKISDAERASHQIAAEQRATKREALQADINTYLEEQKRRLETIATTHDVTIKYLDRLVTSQTYYHTTCKPHLANALIHAKVKEVNSGESQPFSSIKIVN